MPRRPLTRRWPRRPDRSLATARRDTTDDAAAVSRSTRKGPTGNGRRGLDTGCPQACPTARWTTCRGAQGCMPALLRSGMGRSALLGCAASEPTAFDEAASDAAIARTRMPPPTASPGTPLAAVHCRLISGARMSLPPLGSPSGCGLGAHRSRRWDGPRASATKSAVALAARPLRHVIATSRDHHGGVIVTREDPIHLKLLADAIARKFPPLAGIAIEYSWWG